MAVWQSNPSRASRRSPARCVARLIVAALGAALKPGAAGARASRRGRRLSALARRGGIAMPTSDMAIGRSGAARAHETRTVAMACYEKSARNSNGGGGRHAAHRRGSAARRGGQAIIGRVKNPSHLAKAAPAYRPTNVWRGSK